MRFVLLPIAIVWASPASLLGCCCGAIALLTGGGVQCSGRVLEFYGGLVAWGLSKAPLPGGVAAITFGHVVLGRTVAILEQTRDHEFIHVKQYEWWGPLFIPAYLLCSLFIAITGGNGYRDNPFEKQAYKYAP